MYPISDRILVKPSEDNGVVHNPSKKSTQGVIKEISEELSQKSGIKKDDKVVYTKGNHPTWEDGEILREHEILAII